MNSSEFLIAIKTTLEGQGIKLTDDQIKSLEDSAESFSRKNHEGNKTLELDHREMRESLGAIGRAFGGLADVGLWLSPITAALALVLMAADKVKEHFTAINERIKEYIQTSREIKADHLEAVRDAVQATATAMAEYSRQAKAAAAAQNQENTEIQNRLALNDAFIDGLKKVQAAEEKADEAQVDRAVKSGKITAQEGERQKHILQETLDAATANNDAQKEHAKIAEQKQQLAAAQARIPDEQKARDAALAAAQHPSITTDDLEKEKAAKQNILKVQNQAVNDALTKAQEFRTPGSVRSIIDAATDVAAGSKIGNLAKSDAAAEDKIAAGKQKEADKTQELIDAIDKKIFAAKQSVADSKLEADTQNKKLEADKDLVTKLPGQIDQAEKVAKLHEDAAQAVLDAQGRAHETEEGPQPGQAATDAAAKERGPQASLDASSAVSKAGIALANMRGEGSGQQQSQMGILHDILDLLVGYSENATLTASLHNQLISEIATLKTKLAELTSQVQNNRRL